MAVRHTLPPRRPVPVTCAVLTPAEAAAVLGVTPEALKYMDRCGRLHPVRTPGGQRRYAKAEIRAQAARAKRLAQRTVTARTPAAAELSWPGICHHLEITGHPHAGEVTLVRGTPVAPLTLGTDRARGCVVLEIATLAELDELEEAIQWQRAKLAMWQQDHQAHPFGDDEPPAAVTGVAA